MFKPLLTSAAIWPIERLINGIAKTDQHIQTMIGELSGKQLEVETVSPQFHLCIIFDGSDIRISPFSSEYLVSSSDAKVTSDVTTVLGLLSAKAEDRPLANPRLKISGDAQLVQSAFNILNSLDMRWDDWLAPILGGVATQSLKASVDDIQQWTENSAKAFKHNMDDYLKEEANILPTAYGVEEFQERLDRLRLRIDRATARAENLSRHADVC